MVEKPGIDILFSEEARLEAFARNGVPGLSGVALASTRDARRIACALLLGQWGAGRFAEHFSHLFRGSLLVPSGQNPGEFLDEYATKLRASWGRDLLVPVGSEGRGWLLHFHLEPSESWDLGPFDPAALPELLVLYRRRIGREPAPHRLQFAMDPFTLPTKAIEGRSWMLPLYIALHRRAQAAWADGTQAFTGAIRSDGQLEASPQTLPGKHRACNFLGVELVEPGAGAKTLEEALRLDDRRNLLRVEGRSDQEMSASLRRWQIPQGGWNRVLPTLRALAARFDGSEALAASHPSSHDLVLRHLTTALLHTGEAAEALDLLKKVEARLAGARASNILPDIFQDGAAWLSTQFDFFFMEATSLARMGQAAGALTAVEKRLEKLEELGDFLASRFQGASSNRLEFTRTKGIFTRVICLEALFTETGDAAFLDKAWELCHDGRYQVFFKKFASMAPTDLPAWLTVEQVLRSFNYLISVACHMAAVGKLPDPARTALLLEADKLMARHGEMRRDLFFAITRLRILWLAGCLDASKLAVFAAEFHSHRESAYHARTIEALKWCGQRI